MTEATAEAGSYVRIVTIDVPDDQWEQVTGFWASKGRALILSQPGAVRAEAYRSAPGELSVWFEWDSPESARVFREAPEHDAFGRGMRTPAEQVKGRQEWRRIPA
jgi:heme-degrading monooxygenase HmoA